MQDTSNVYEHPEPHLIIRYLNLAAQTCRVGHLLGGRLHLVSHFHLASTSTSAEVNLCQGPSLLLGEANVQQASLPNRPCSHPHHGRGSVCNLASTFPQTGRFRPWPRYLGRRELRAQLQGQSPLCFFKCSF